jgi:hypothetical protein
MLPGFAAATPTCPAFKSFNDYRMGRSVDIGHATTKLAQTDTWIGPETLPYALKVVGV